MARVRETGAAGASTSCGSAGTNSDIRESQFVDWVQTLRSSSDLERRCAAAEALVKSGDARAASVLKEVLDRDYANPPYLELALATRGAIKAAAEACGRTDLGEDTADSSRRLEELIDALFALDNTQRSEPIMEKAPSGSRETQVLQAELWRCEKTSSIRELIAGLARDELSMLIEYIDVSVLPLNVWRTDGSLDARFNLAGELCRILVCDRRVEEARPLLDKILRRVGAKIEEGGASGDEFTNPSHLSATTADILTDLAQALLTEHMNQEAATCLEAVTCDLPTEESMLWLFASYNNLFRRTGLEDWATMAAEAGRALLERYGSRLNKPDLDIVTKLVGDLGHAAS